MYLVTSVLGRKRGIVTAIFAALAGSLIYALASTFLGTGFLAAALGGLAWLFAIRYFYDIGWLKSLLVAVVIWLIAGFVSFFLPTVSGPL
ncbi:MAG: hypothetical protein ACLFS3_01510 [Candidatus Aenigmatarchaeota archaeon]